LDQEGDTVSVHRRASTRGNRYDVRFRTPDGAHRKRTFRTRREADAFEAQQRADMSRGSWLDPRDAERTFDEVARHWLERDVAKRSSTLGREETILRVHILPTLSGRRLRTIRQPDVQALVNSWVVVSKPRTVRRHYGVLRAVLAYAVECDYLGRTPCRGIRLPEVKPLDRPQLSAEQVVALAEAMGADLGAMVYLGAILGLRWGECAGLRVARLDLEDRRLTVAEQLTRGTHGVHFFGEPKSHASRRTLAMPEALADMLSELLHRRPLTTAKGDALLFTAPGGEPLRYEHWRRRHWLPACDTTGLAGVTFHDLRRANATGLLAEGVDVRTAQARLGHSDPRMTLAIYAQATSEGDHRAADALGARFLGPRATRAMDAP
jgi:integrase